jgi:probable blue pigment (indigoidine) exporter
MEPLITVFMAWVFLRERLTRSNQIAFALALTGFAFLSVPSDLSVFSSNLRGGADGTEHGWGNLIILISLIGEASYSILGRQLLVRFKPQPILGTALVIGVGFLTLALLSSGSSAFHFEHFYASSVFGALWLGVLGTTMTYLYWMIVLREAPVASLAVTLFVQPVFGSLWGYLVLHDRLTLFQAFGAALIFLGVFSQSGVNPVLNHRPGRMGTAGEMRGVKK